MEFIEQPAATPEAETSSSNNLSIEPEGKILKEEPSSPLIKLSETISPVRDVLSNWSNDLYSFWANPDNQRLLLNILLLGMALFSLYILLVVLAAINHLPLLPALLKLIGLGYSVWFGGRYLIWSKNRQELMVKWETIKTQIISSQSQAGELES